MSKVTYTTLTTVQAERDESGHLWVINKDRSNINEHVDRVNLVLNIPEGTVAIEPSFAPQDLAEVADKAIIVKSRAFKAAVSSGLLDIVSPGDAEKLLALPSYRAETERVRKDKIRRQTQTLQQVASTTGALKNPVNPGADGNNAESMGSRNPIVVAIMETSQPDSDSMYASLKDLADSNKIKEADYDYIVEKCNHMRLVKLGRWAERRKQTYMETREEITDDFEV